ncbi:MAG: hypothetical protein KJS91_12730 [Planctomycetes bacterium]|nr:hypothetical protein [Planctomycetota bacterium]
MNNRFGMGWIAVALAAAGCGQDGPQWTIDPQPVSGQVLYDGKPAAGVNVGLFPIDAPMPPAIPSNPRAVTDANGNFKITTFKDGDGACEGKYQVLMNWPQKAAENAEETTDKLLGWYDGAHSSIYVKVVKGANQIPVIKCPPRTVSPAQMNGIPGRN